MNNVVDSIPDSPRPWRAPRPSLDIMDLVGPPVSLRVEYESLGAKLFVLIPGQKKSNVPFHGSESLGPVSHLSV